MRYLPLWVLALTLGACSFAPKLAPPEAATSLPERFAEADSARTAAPAAAAVTWWRTFDDPVLDRLVDSALVRNYDLRAAVARVEEVQNRYRIARSALFPGVQGSVEASRQSTPSNAGATGSFAGSIPGFPDRFEVTTYSASLGLSYELDFWGRVRNSTAAAVSEYIATKADAHTARIGILSETIATYFEITEIEAQIALTRENVDLLAERAELTRQRYARGLVNSFELYAIEQEFEDASAGLPLLESALADAAGRLAVLLGLFPAEADALLGDRRTAEVVPTAIPAGLPSDLLRARPDLVAAEARLEAARRRIGVAKAEQFPRLALTGTGGVQSSELSTLLQYGQRFSILGASLTAPLFQGGRLRANVNVAEAQYAQQAAAYEKAVLTAFTEVGTRLTAYAKEQERHAFLLGALENAEASAQNQQRRYVRGVGDYLAYLDAQRNLVRVRTALATSRRALANARLGVHRALGGAWVSDDIAEM